MDDFAVYPVHDFGPLMKGLLIGGMGIFHVFLAQFAIGGGMLMCYFQWLALTGRDRDGTARRFVDGYFKYLVLVSFVLGALTGVGMWFTAIQVSAQTIGMMVREFHWLWATEWTFFSLEVISGYLFYRYGPRLGDRMRMKLLAVYSIAAWFSLFWINGIISWQLTPGEWLQSGDVFDGFFNPGFWPSLVYRTIACMVIAGLAACVVINTMKQEPESRQRLLERATHFMLPMILMPVPGIWYLLVMPAQSRQWILGGSAAMTLFLNIAVAASVLVAAYAWIALWRQRLNINGATSTLLLVLAFAASAGGEFVREGVRKPYTIRQTLYSNSITPEKVAWLREHGSASIDPYPILDAGEYPNDQVLEGARVFRFQCSVCHTVSGVNGLIHLAGTWTDDQKRMNIAKLQFTKSFMPPFAGPAREVESLVQWINWQEAGKPDEWLASNDPAKLESIARWLDEAGTRQGKGG